ncbi:MAG: hypothetical protein KBC91_00060 [Candidatus Omnitrophica bacterium]|nr:hypothetical protein [Candidatus Omnitrophota bacterium]
MNKLREMGSSPPRVPPAQLTAGKQACLTEDRTRRILNKDVLDQSLHPAKAV